MITKKKCHLWLVIISAINGTRFFSYFKSHLLFITCINCWIIFSLLFFNHTYPGEAANVNVNGGVTGGKSGYVNCAVCGVTRFYSCVQRRYGQFTCVTCYRYFRTFLLKPKKYSCPNLGECLLNVRTRCRACWLKACIDVFSVDLRRQHVIDDFRPVRKLPSKQTSSSLNSTQIVDSNNDDNNIAIVGNDTIRQSNGSQSNEISTITVSFNSGNELPSILEKNEATLRAKSDKSSTPKPVKVTVGKKVWSCGKCATCLAEDCGKCIYCLDRPKFGGPFIKKQRCIKRRCLMKIKNKTNGSATC